MDKLGHAALNPPEMDRVSSIVLFVFSILLPGVTQFVFGLFYGCDWPYMVVGVLMFILSPFMLGTYPCTAYLALRIGEQFLTRRRLVLEHCLGRARYLERRSGETGGSRP